MDPVLQAHRGSVVAVAAVLPVLACLALVPFRDSVANTNAALALVLVVVAAAATGIRLAGITAGLAGAVAFDYFLTQPYGTFAITDRADLETAVLLLLVGLAVTEVALWGRRQQAAASREKGYLDGVVGTAASVADRQSSPAVLLDQVARQIQRVLGVDDCRFDPATRLGYPTITGDGTLLRSGHQVDVMRRGLPADTVIALPVRHDGVVQGHFLITSATRIARPSAHQLRIAVTLANQAGAILPAVTDARRLPH